MSDMHVQDSATIQQLAQGAVSRSLQIRKSNGKFRESSYQYTLPRENGGEERFVIQKQNVIVSLMVAPRRCGKTTLMGAIISEFNRVMGEDFAIESVSADKMEKITARQRALQQFSNAPIFYSGIEASDSLEIYEFLIYHRKHPRNVFLYRFVDVPGEWVRVYPSAMRTLIEGSDVLYMTINAPAMLEEEGKYCQEINAPQNILELTDVLCNAKVASARKRLMLFVPVKCEKYYWDAHEGRNENMLAPIADGVESLFRPLLDKIRSIEAVRNSLTIGITPILTVGGVKFSQFRHIMHQTEQGSVRVLSEEYVRLNGYINDKDGYSPRLCEQPLLYTLRFVTDVILARLRQQTLGNFFADASKYGVKKALKFAFSNPLYTKLVEVSRLADFHDFRTFEDYLQTESQSCHQAPKKLPEGVYVDNSYLGMRILNDPDGLFRGR